MGTKLLCESYFGAKKSLSWLELGKTSYNDFVLERGEYLRIVGAPNESLGLIIIYYMFTYKFGNKTTLLE